MTELTESTLCQTCKSLFQGANHHHNKTTPKSETGEIPHHGLEALAARASKCHLCLTIFMSIDPDAYRNFRRGSVADSVGFVWISPIARDQARLKFRYVKAAALALNGESSGSTGSSGSGGSARSRATPDENRSKTSLSFSADADSTLVVELILMNPKCEFPFACLLEYEECERVVFFNQR